MTSSIGIWLLGARLKTLPAGISPVLVGTACATPLREVRWQYFFLAIAVAVFLQLGVNYANDYFDGAKGRDENRVGPTRLVASGLAKPASVKLAALVCFGLAAVAGGWLSILVNPWLLAAGAVCLLAGWFYSGGKRGYAAVGLGELSVFIFFGLAATLGSGYVQTGNVTLVMLAAGCVMGVLAVLMMLLNNSRDRQADEIAGKMTLCVLLGRSGTKYFTAALLAFGAIWYVVYVKAMPYGLLALVGLPLIVKPMIVLFSNANNDDMIKALGEMGRGQLAVATLMAVGSWTSFG